MVPGRSFRTLAALFRLSLDILVWRKYVLLGNACPKVELLNPESTTVYESEFSPARLRGRILTSWQTGTALGIALSGTMPLIVPKSWRFQISSSFIPALALLLLVYVGSESPRWLIKKSRFAEAYKVLLRLRGTPVLAARDLILIRAQLNVEIVLFMPETDDTIDLGNKLPHLTREEYQKEINLMGYGRRIIQLFTIPRVRRATLASFIVMSAQ